MYDVDKLMNRSHHRLHSVFKYCFINHDSPESECLSGMTPDLASIDRSVSQHPEQKNRSCLISPPLVRTHVHARRDLERCTLLLFHKSTCRAARCGIVYRNVALYKKKRKPCKNCFILEKAKKTNSVWTSEGMGWGGAFSIIHRIENGVSVYVWVRGMNKNGIEKKYINIHVVDS